MGAPFEIFSSPARYGDTNNTLLLKIWWWISGKGGSGGGIPVTPASPVGTYTYFHVANSGTLSGGIPVTAKRWAVNFVGTGTANTFGSNTALTGGQSFSDNAVPSGAIAVICDGSTVADGFYSTT